MFSKFAFFSVENIVIVEMLVGKELPLVLMFDMSKQYQRVFLKLDHNVSQLMAIGVSKMGGDIRGAQGDPANLTLRHRLPAPAFDSGVAAADHRLLMLA